MLWKLLQTRKEVVPLVLRLTCVVMFPHNTQKILGWWRTRI